MRAATNPVDRSLRTHLQNAATGAIRILDFLATTNKAARWEVRALDDLEQLFDVDFGIANNCDGRIQHLSKIVGRNLCRHADCNSI